MTPDTMFALHSMTKPITSLAAMMLVERQDVTDDPIAKYIPSFANTKVGVEVKDPEADTVTRAPPNRAILPSPCLDLLRHASGITYD